MPQQNISLDETLQQQMKEFCAHRGLSLTKMGQAAILAFMEASPEWRERALLRLASYLAGDKDVRDGDQAST